MNKKIVLFLIFVSASLTALCLEVKKDKENVVSSRLIGTWKTNKELTKRLYGRDKVEITVSFKEDKEVAKKIPEKYAKFLKGKQIYLAGYMIRNGKEYPFILSDYSGNPYIFFFMERNGDPMGNGESFNVVITPAEKTENDLLFIGGDFNNQPFAAFDRVK